MVISGPRLPMSLRAKFGRYSVRATASPHQPAFRRVLSALLIAVLLAASLAVQPRSDLSGGGAATSAGHLNYADTDRGDAEALPRKSGAVAVEFRSVRATLAGIPEPPDMLPVPVAAPGSGPSRLVFLACRSSAIPGGPPSRSYDAQAPPSGSPA